MLVVAVGVGWCCCCVGKLVAAAALRSARANTLLSPTRPHQGWPVPATTPTNTQQHSTAATTLQQQPGPPLSQHWCCTPGCVSTSGWCGYWPSLARRAGRAAGGSVSCTGGTTAATSGPGRHCSMQHAAWGRVGTCAGGGWSVVTLGTGHRRWWLESPSVGGSRARPVDNGLVVVGAASELDTDRADTLPALSTAAAHTPPYHGGKPSKRYNYRISLRPSVTTTRDSLCVSPHITHGGADSSNPAAGSW